jgi:hypothetical protein
MSFILQQIIQPPLTAGGVVYGTGSSTAVTAAGTAGQVLTSTGSGAPVFADVSSGGSNLLFTAYSLPLTTQS